jgi:hypothetical protein
MSEKKQKITGFARGEKQVSRQRAVHHSELYGNSA